VKAILEEENHKMRIENVRKYPASIWNPRVSATVFLRYLWRYTENARNSNWTEIGKFVLFIMVL
jgi:hypothetical protein